MDVECMLLGVDFNCGTFKLAPFDTDAYEDESFIPLMSIATSRARSKK